MCYHLLQGNKPLRRTLVKHGLWGRKESSFLGNLIPVESALAKPGTDQFPLRKFSSISFIYVFGNDVASLLEFKHFTQHIAATWIPKPHWSTLILELHLRQVFLGTLCHTAQLVDCKCRDFQEPIWKSLCYSVLNSLAQKTFLQYTTQKPHMRHRPRLSHLPRPSEHKITSHSVNHKPPYFSTLRNFRSIPRHRDWGRQGRHKFTGDLLQIQLIFYHLQIRIPLKKKKKSKIWYMPREQ